MVVTDYLNALRMNTWFQWVEKAMGDEARRQGIPNLLSSLVKGRGWCGETHA